jgi:hypothetical protein
MQINKLFLDYFGRFHGYEIDFQPGINLIYGDNEAGKSTIHTFIRGMLFGIERARGRASASREDIYSRYLPWDYPGAYRGSMDIMTGDRRYHLYRSFYSNDKCFTVTDLETGREVKLMDNHISEIVPGLTESAFINTVSIEQLKVSTNSELASALRNYIANLSISKSNEVNVAKAIEYLTLQKKSIEGSVDQTELKALEAAINKGNENEQALENLTLQQKEILEENVEIEKEQQLQNLAIDGEKLLRMEQLPAILEKYHYFQELTGQLAQIKERQMEWKRQAAMLEKEQASRETLAKDRDTAKEISERIEKQSRISQELQKENADIVRRVQRNLWILMGLSGFAAFLTMLLTRFQPAGLLISAMFLLAGLVGAAVFTKNGRQKQKSLAVREEEEANSYEELLQKQAEAVKTAYELENARQQSVLLRQQEDRLEDSRDAVYEEIMKYMQQFTREEELTDEAMQRLKEEIDRRRQQQKQLQQENSRKLETNRIRMEKLKWETANLEKNEEELLKNKERYAQLEQLQGENQVELEAIRLALTTIRELSIDIHDSFGHQLNTAVSDVIGEVTNHKYSDLKVDEKLNIKVGWKGTYLPFEKLSAGTIDQIYLSLRLAVADLLLGKNTMPLIFDDSFALYDEDRVRAAIQQLSKRQQVILFTCHKREQKILEELKLPYHYVEL